jgi:hypothetical protein
LLLSLAGTAIVVPTDVRAQVQTLNAGFGPQRYRDGGRYGIGVYFAPYRFSIYARPEEDAPVLAAFQWSRQGGTGNISMTTPAGGMSGVYADRTFLCFYPALDVAMLAVTGENGQGWAEVVYDQKQGKTGWVRLKTPGDARGDTTDDTTGTNTGGVSQEPAHFGAYQTWLEFMRLNAKVSGVYWLSGVSGYHRALRSRDDDTAKLLPVTMIRSMKVRFVRGNWLLVEALDFERNTPIGWIRWRDDDGNLMAFPNLAGLRTPILITGE